MYYCDCKKLSNGNFRGMSRVLVYSDGICENCHHYAVLDAGSKREHIDKDIDITKSVTSVTLWHREIKTREHTNKARRLTIDQEKELVQLSLDGVPTKALMNKFGVASPTTISSIFKRHGVNRKSGRPKGNCNRGLNLIGGV